MTDVTVRFPLSKYGTEKEFRLSYEALEVACHAIEQYCERLRGDHVGKLMVIFFHGKIQSFTKGVR